MGGLAAIAVIFAVAGCGGDDAKPLPADEPDVLVAMGLHDLGRATSIDVSEGGRDHERRHLEFGCGDALFQFVRSADRLVYCGYEQTVYSKPRVASPAVRFT